MLFRINKNESGFTLVEVLVTIMILSIVTALIFRFISFGLDSFSFGVDQIEEQSNLRLTAFKVTDNIRNARNLDLLDNDTYTKRIYFSGSKLMLDDGVNPAYPISSDLQSANFVMTPSNGKSLLRFTLIGNDGETIVSEVLLNNIGEATEIGVAIDFDNLAPAVVSSPVVVITAPTSGSVYSSGSSVTFSATATDAEDGDLSSSLAWTSHLDGAIGSGASTSKSLSDGTHIITASVADSETNVGSYSINVIVGTVANHPPVATDQAETCKKKQSITIDLDVSDADGDTLTVTITTGPTKGTLSDLTGTSIKYTAPDLKPYSDSFAYTVSDGNGGTDNATVTITEN